MPVNYLDDDEDLLPLRDDDEEDRLPQSKFPVAAAADTSRILGLDRPPVQPGMSFEASDAAQKRGELASAIKSKPDAPQPKWYQRLAAAAMGAGAGWVNAAGRTRPIDISSATRGIMAPGYDRKLDDWRNRVSGAQAASDASNANEQSWLKNWQAKNAEALNAAQVGHMNAQTAALPGQAVTSAIEHGGEVLPDGQTNPNDREGSTQDIGGKKLFFASKKQAEKDKKIADQAAWSEVTPEMAESLTDLGVEAGTKVPPTVFNQYQRIIQKQSQSPKLTFQHFTNDQTGDVTTIGYDPTTGEAKVRTIEKGIAKKQVPAMIQIGNQLAGNQDAVTTAAVQYRQTRTMPPVGRNPMMAIAILKRVAEMDKSDGLTPEQSGVQAEMFKANRTALSDITKREQQVATMEKTAGKNLDVFLNVAQKVSDTGLVPANRVFRGAARAFGDPNMAAFEAARTTAFTEISRVLSGSMSNVLSDSSRKEAESILRGDYTLPQLMRVAQTLRMDMKNRMDSFAEQRKQLQQDMGGGATREAGGGNTGGGRGGGNQRATGGGAVHFVDGGISYDIPADKVQAFQLAHPNAKRGQ